MIHIKFELLFLTASAIVYCFFLIFVVCRFTYRYTREEKVSHSSLLSADLTTPANDAIKKLIASVCALQLFFDILILCACKTDYFEEVLRAVWLQTDNFSKPTY